MVLSILAPTGDHVVALVENFQHFRDIRRIILSVAVQGNNHFSASMVEPCHHCCRLTQIPFEMDYPNPVILISQLLKDPFGMIGAAIVDKDQFPRDSELRQFSADTLVNINKCLRLVENGHDD